MSPESVAFAHTQTAHGNQFADILRATFVVPDGLCGSRAFIASLNLSVEYRRASAQENYDQDRKRAFEHRAQRCGRARA